MFSLILLCANLVILIYILIYGLCFIALPFFRPANSQEDNSLNSGDEGGVTVLVPCHHEGPALVNTIESLLRQDYSGPVKIIVLFKDHSDSSFSALDSRFKLHWPLHQKTAVIHQEAGREVIGCCCGIAPKREKLNQYLPLVSTEYIAFLDADHRADTSWISASVQKLRRSDLAGVQSRRAPLSLRKLPQIWDSAQNHIGNELVNTTLSKTVGSVFFTGTTCVFKTEKLRGRSFSDCVTEDTFLSYELLRDGERIGYLSSQGSREEVAPDLRSYIARRRRWSCGHNKTFFTLGASVLRSPIGWRAKAVTLIHGLFYTVPVAVCVLLNIYALHLFVQYTGGIQLNIFLIALTLAMAISLIMFGKHRSVGREIAVLMLWIFPQVALIFPIPLYYTDNELVFFLTLFPYVRYLFWFQLFGIAAPVILLIAGSTRVRVLATHQVLLVLLSYPAIMFLDLWACLLGFSDFLFGRPTWAKIQRTHEEDALDPGARPNSFRIIARWSGVVACAALLLVSINDLTADANCGQPDAFVGQPEVFVPANDIKWQVQETKTMRDPDNLSIEFASLFAGHPANDIQIAHFVDEKLKNITKGDAPDAHSYAFTAPLGWETHKYKAVLRSGSAVCKREIPFTMTLKELRDGKLFLNGEDFLVKGVIPSFSPAQKTPTMAQGLAQIKELGANTVRYYHAVRDEAKQEIERQQLLVIDQPDYSTWTDVNLGYALSRFGLKRRFEELMQENLSFPYSLFHTFGNELEIFDAAARIPELRGLIEQVAAENPRDWFSYSTFFVYLRVPAAIYGANMLDSGEAYWRDGLASIIALKKPFYASEFGGFVAFTERTPETLRIYRLFDYWNRLMQAGAFGAVIHESHDNWAQPVVQGYNDPLTPDQPDDVRGIWDHDNKEKLFGRFVADLFSDFDATVEDSVLLPHSAAVSIRFKNERNYALRDVRFFDGDTLRAGPIDFAPEAEQSISIALPPGDSSHLALSAKYTTHHGLSAISSIGVELPLQGSTPTVLNKDAIDLSPGASALEGKLLRGGDLTIVLPKEWDKATVNGAAISAQPGRNVVHLRPSMEEATDLEDSSDGINWHTALPQEIGKGPQRVRFKLQHGYPRDAMLLLAGLGAEQYWIRYGTGEWREMESHYYRENIVPLDEIASGSQDDFFYLLLPRKKTLFIEPQDHPLGKTVEIQFELPRVFSPVPFRIERAR